MREAHASRHAVPECAAGCFARIAHRKRASRSAEPGTCAYTAADAAPAAHAGTESHANSTNGAQRRAAACSSHAVTSTGHAATFRRAAATSAGCANTSSSHRGAASSSRRAAAFSAGCAATSSSHAVTPTSYAATFSSRAAVSFRRAAATAVTMRMAAKRVEVCEFGAGRFHGDASLRK
ncbi:MAG TPA: hypothetical protein VKB67_09840 [Rhizomicrobium sp.]|nr:hypothetical protein [Rhizomicrobium sp.]